jgi:hypothetical protein
MINKNSVIYSFKIIKVAILLPLMLSSFPIFAQVEDLLDEDAEFTLDAYIGTYYAYDFIRPFSNELPGFLYNHNRHNEFNLNLGFIRANWQGEIARASLGIMAGTYAQYNLAHEQPLLQHVYEANAGIKIVDGLWLDAGIVPSFYGAESALSLENPTLTRSLIAENSPYYLSGALLTYIPNDQWKVLASILNGWQNIRRVPGLNQRAFGTQVLFSPTESLSFNSSAFLGNSGITGQGKLRFFHNFYTVWSPTDLITFFGSFDFGVDQGGTIFQPNDVWWQGFSIIGRISLLPQFAFSARVEGYNDPGGANLVLPPLYQGARLGGYSLTLDYIPRRNIRLSTEGKYFSANDSIFLGEDRISSNTFIWTTSLAVLFKNR